MCNKKRIKLSERDKIYNIEGNVSKRKHNLANERCKTHKTDQITVEE